MKSLLFPSKELRMSSVSSVAEKNIRLAHFFLRPQPSLAPPHDLAVFSSFVSIR
nr:MAG TPA: hypothetical protein [Bacteriophage sp.]